MVRDDLEHYRSICLICWEREEAVMPRHPGQSALLALQAHFMALLRHKREAAPINPETAPMTTINLVTGDEEATPEAVHHSGSAL